MPSQIRSFVSDPTPRKIAVTGAAGRIGYQLLFFLAAGKLLDPEQPIVLYLLEKAHNLSKCQAIQMELEDCNFPALIRVCITSDPNEAFSDADYIFFCGAKIARALQERQSVRYENWENLAAQGESLNRVGSAKTLIMMVANPCNTNAWILLKKAPNIPSSNFHALVQLDYNRTLRALFEKTQVRPSEIEGVIVWGNHSPTIVPDLFYARVKGLSIKELVEFNFIHKIQSRGHAITLASGGMSSSGSAALAAIEAMRSLILPTPEGKFFCSAAYTSGNPFGLDEDLIFSMPYRTLSQGKYEVLSRFPPHSALMPLIKATEAELQEEREFASKI